jgi:hypothetical protein
MLGRLEWMVSVRGSYTRSYIGCVLATVFVVDEVVVKGLEAADKRAATLSGDVLLLRGRCRGEKYVCKSR